MQRTLMVIDDFLPNPMELREHARTVQWEIQEEKKYYPGRNAKTIITINGLDEIVSKLLEDRLEPAPNTSHGRFRLALGGDSGRGGVHIDKAHWSGILYLTPDEYCQGGTDFFRHKRTNSTTAPLTKAQVNAIGYEDFESYWNELLIPESRDFDKWELVTHIPMKFNRLLLFQPWMYHNAGPSFGDSVDNGRLIYPLFYVQKP